MKSTMKVCMFLSMVMLALGFSACGSSPATYTIGGTVTNLVAAGGVKLQNGAETLTVTANGSFTFRSGLRRGSTYKVTISVQPSSPAQTCGVTHGSGTVTGDVTDVAIDCGHNEWTWMSGANVVGHAGTYGTQGTPAPGNVPGAQGGAVSWTDAAGNFWLFGGIGLDSAGTNGYLNALWKYSAGEWTWMSGANVVGQTGTYGTQGTPAPGNVPGARGGAVTWTDAAGNLWLFGGLGPDSAGTYGYFNDLWKYSAGEWTWMGGANVVNQAGTYGTLGTPAPGNVPGARGGAVTWTDAAGNLWLFGGYGLDSAGTLNLLNDLWKYSAGEWTWMSGANVGNQAGTYGTLGTPAPGNVPGVRYQAVTWTDAAGNFWLFGGLGLDSAGTVGYPNDLWKYSAGEWTWMGGANVVGHAGTYGTQGTPAPGNVPGARYQAVTWTDAAGNFWLFGGLGLDSAWTFGWINDLWKYSAGEWTWMGGANVVYQAGTYGTQGTPAPGNVPGARGGAVTWTDAAGNLWLFGGRGLDSTGTNGDLNDLWKYEP